MIELVQFIREHGIVKLATEFAIKVNQHREFTNLYSCTYNMIDSPLGETIVRQCRGIVLDSDNDWLPVCYPYNKFFNFGEGHAAELDWDSVRIYEKVDGTMIGLYFYGNRWNVSTTGTPDAGGPVNDMGIRFSDLFWSTWNDLYYSLPNEENKTFIFELMTPMNQLIVDHSKDKIVLHGVRDVNTFLEESPEFYAAKYGWECVRSFDKTDNMTALSLIADNMKGKEQEGFVVVDKFFNRVKIKCPDYVRMAHMKNSFGVRSVIENVQKGEINEIIAYFPNLAELLTKVNNLYQEFATEIDKYFKNIETIENQKEFAFEALKTPYSSALFCLRKNKNMNAKEWLSNLQPDKVADMLNVREEIMKKYCFVSEM
jgi:hypothetical protein